LPNIEKTLKTFTWHSLQETLGDTGTNRAILLKIVNLAFCAGPDVYSSLFNSILVFIFNLTVGLDKMKLLTDENSFNIKCEIFRVHKM